MGDAPLAGCLPGQGGDDGGFVGVGTYIDASVLNSVLSGLLLVLGAVWIRYAFNRLWQQSLSEEAGDAIQAAAQLGLTLRPLAYRARLVADGAVSGEPVRLEWRGGVRGAHTLLVRAGRREVLPLLTSASALHAALSPPT